MKTIEIDGVKEAVWRCRALVTWRMAGVFPFSGGDWAESLRKEPLTSGQVPRDHQLEFLLTEDVLLCTTDEATNVAAAVVIAIDTVRGEVTMKSGEVIPAKIGRRAHLAEEARAVREERFIMALSHTKGAKDAKGERKQATMRKSKTKTKKNQLCGVCGWRHDATFSRIEIPGRRVILLHGAMAEIVALVHAAQAGGAGAVSTKDERMLNICGGYRHPCKVFNDLKRRAEYKVLFETRRRGVLGLKNCRSL